MELPEESWEDGALRSVNQDSLEWNARADGYMVMEQGGRDLRVPMGRFPELQQVFDGRQVSLRLGNVIFDLHPTRPEHLRFDHEDRHARNFNFYLSPTGYERLLDLARNPRMPSGTAHLRGRILSAKG